MFSLKFRKKGGQPRLHFRQDTFDYYNDLSQQFELVPQRLEIATVVTSMVFLIDNQTVTNLFNGKSIDSHHDSRDDINLAVTIMASLLKRRYADIADFKAYVRQIVTLVNNYKLRARNRERAKFGIYLSISVLNAMVASVYGAWTGVVGVSAMIGTFLIGERLEGKEITLLLDSLQVKSIPSTTS